MVVMVRRLASSTPIRMKAPGNHGKDSLHVRFGQIHGQAFDDDQHRHSLLLDFTAPVVHGGHGNLRNQAVFRQQLCTPGHRFRHTGEVHDSDRRRNFNGEAPDAFTAKTATSFFTGGCGLLIFALCSRFPYSCARRSRRSRRPPGWDAGRARRFCRRRFQTRALESAGAPSHPVQR